MNLPVPTEFNYVCVCVCLFILRADLRNLSNQRTYINEFYTFDLNEDTCKDSAAKLTLTKLELQS